MRAWVAEAKKEAGPDEFLRNSSDSASYFLCSFSLGHLDGSGWDENTNYSNSQSSICFLVFLWYFSFETVRFRTVLYGFAMFSSNCIVILLSLICYRLKSTNSLKYYNIHKALQFPYKQKVVSCLESLLHFHLKDRLHKPFLSSMDHVPLHHH